jgi:hypothetical protein
MQLAENINPHVDSSEEEEASLPKLSYSEVVHEASQIVNYAQADQAELRKVFVFF